MAQKPDLYRPDAAAHLRRARLIAELHKLAVAAANNDPPILQEAVKATVTSPSQWRKADSIIAMAILGVVGAAMVVAAVGFVLGLW
jgi:hypothetical protein